MIYYPFAAGIKCQVYAAKTLGFNWLRITQHVICSQLLMQEGLFNSYITLALMSDLGKCLSVLTFKGYDVMWSSRWVPVFWKNLLLPSSRQNVQATGSSELLVPECKTTLCHTYQKKVLLIFTTIRTSTLIFYVSPQFFISVQSY